MPRLSPEQLLSLSEPSLEYLLPWFSESQQDALTQQLRPAADADLSGLSGPMVVDSLSFLEDRHLKELSSAQVRAWGGLVAFHIAFHVAFHSTSHSTVLRCGRGEGSPLSTALR